MASIEINIENGTEGLVQMASVLGEVTGNPEQLSLDSQVKQLARYPITPTPPPPF